MIRRAAPDDVTAIGELFLRTRDAMSYLPPVPDDVRRRLGSLIVARTEVWVADDENGVVGFAGLSGDELTHLYTDPAAQSRGIGGALLDHAKTLRPERLELWVFQQNDGARRLYERHGFRLVKLTDGSGNMEHEPDALYEWRPDASG
jgi:GNAT superfamily N-acetyltransferase